MTTSTDALGRSSAVQSSPPRTRTDPMGEFLASVASLETSDYAKAYAQSRSGGEVSRADPKLWNAYQGYLRTVPIKDSPELRKEFLRQVIARDSYMSDKKIDKPTALNEAAFRATHAVDTLSQREDKKLKEDDAWMVPALAYPGLDFDPEVLKMLRGVSVEGSRTSNLADLVKARSSSPLAPGMTPASRNTVRQPVRRESVFDRALKAPAKPPPAAKPVQAETPYLRGVAIAAKSPEDARASLLALNSNASREVTALEGRSKVATVDLIGPSASRDMREGYREFLNSRNVPDTLANQREFTSLLSLRASYMSRKGLTGGPYSAADERAFLAETALARLRMREQTKQPLTPREGEGWMKQVLSDPSVRLSPDDLRLLGDVKWTNQGLGNSLAEERAKAIRNAAENKPPPLGAPFAVTLNAESVFDNGDVQTNAFSLAARAAGYNDEEVGRALQYMRDKQIKLYCHQGQEGQPLILKREDANVKAVAGQEFVRYGMSGEASEILRDARYAGAGTSVADYRARAQESWSGTLMGLGEQALSYVQGKAREYGLEEGPNTGPLVRGLYDGIREATVVAANAGQNAEMAATTFKKGWETGNLLYTVKGDAEQSRYFDAVKANALAAVDRSGKTYSAEETTEAAKFVRGLVGGIPKMATAVVPGSFLLYNALKHTNNDMNEFGKETVIDIAGLFAGPLAGQLTGGLKNVAARALPTALIDNAVASRVTQEVIERGTSGVVGATSNVLTDMGPTAARQWLGNATPEEVKKNLTLAAFARNVTAGFAMGLLSPERGDRDVDVLSKKSTQIEGPVYGVRQLDGETKYYAAARVESTTGGKPHFEFLEVSATDPKVQAKIKNKEVASSTQAEADSSLLQSRWDKMTPNEREQFKAAINRYAEQQTKLDAERAVITLSKPKPTGTLAEPSPVSTPSKVSAKKVEVPAKKTEAPTAPVAPKPGPVEAGIPPERITRAQEKIREADAVYRDSDADDAEAVVSQALLDMATEVDASPEVSQKLAALNKHANSDFRQLLLPGRDDVAPLLRTLSSKDPAVKARVQEILDKVGNQSLDSKGGRAELQELALKGPPAKAPVVLSEMDKKLDALLAKAPPSKDAAPSSLTPLSPAPVDLSTYRSDGATQAKIRELLGGGAKQLEKDVERLKDFNPEYKSIPTEDLLALRAYSSSLARSNYEVTNPALRKQDPKELARLSPLIGGASSAVNQMPPYKGRVYRGMRSDKMPPEVLAQYMPGQTVTEKSFTSSSKSQEFASTFDDPDVVMVIQSRGKGRDMEKASRSVDEREVLFTPGTSFRVLARETDKTGKTIIYMDQLP